MSLTNAFAMVQEFLCFLAYHFIYNVTYVISVCQIKYNHCAKYVKRIKNDYWVVPNEVSVEDKPRDQLLLIKNGKELCCVDPLNVGRAVLHFMNEDTGALIFAPDSNALYISNIGVGAGASENHLFLSNNHCYKMDERTGEMECIVPKYTFMSILAIFKKEVSGTMLINLKRIGVNYNVVGTALNAEFIKYYALKYGGDHLRFDEEYTGPIEYELQVVDGDANFFSMTHKDEIVLNRLTYEVRPFA